MAERLDIQGGEQFLPFARARIKALRATGLSYVSNKYEVDGVSVTVRLEGQHDYIKIEGGGGRVCMDTGLVDLVTGNPNMSDYGLPGVLHETASIGAYNQPFVLDPEVPGSLRRNAVGRPFHQISGIVDFTVRPSFVGRVPVNAQTARSFGKKRTLVPASDPEAFQTDPSDDDALRTKKEAALACSPSIFTGRCRLFVQALYGAHMHTYPLDTTQTDGESKPVYDSFAPPTLAIADGGSPGLKLKVLIEKGDKTDQSDVVISTSTGVYFDKKTWHHTLVNIEFGEIVVYPLVASKAGEKLRRVARKMQAKYSADDIARVEAYILSSSRPNVTRREKIGDVSHVSSVSAMGYGWHWNWSGTRANIVVNAYFLQNPADVSPTAPIAMRSTHFGIVLSIADGDGHPALRTTASASVVSGPSDWSAPRGLWVFCEPNWGARRVEKTTPKYTSAFNGSAPFYVFYKGDEIQLCTFSTSSVTAGEPSRVRVDPYGGFAGPNYGDHINGFTYGYTGGYVEDILPPEDHVSASVSIGAVGFGGLTSSYAEEGGFLEVGGKGITADYPFPSSGWNPSSAGPPMSGTEGYPPYSDWTSPNLVRSNSSTTTWTWTVESGSKDYIKFGQLAVVVPIGDSEAIFVWTRRTVKTTKTATKKALTSGWPWATCSWIQLWNEDTEITGYNKHIRFEPAFYNGIGVTQLSESDSSVPTTNEYTIVQRLISKAGATPATFGSIDDNFFDNDVELIAGNYFVTSGANLDSPFVMSPGRIATVGGAPDIDTSSEATILTHPVVPVGYI